MTEHAASYKVRGRRRRRRRVFEAPVAAANVAGGRDGARGNSRSGLQDAQTRGTRVGSFENLRGNRKASEMGRARRHKNVGVGQGQDSDVPRIRGVFIGRPPAIYRALSMVALRLPQQEARAYGQNRGLRENPRQACKFGGLFGAPQSAVPGVPGTPYRATRAYATSTSTGT